MEPITGIGKRLVGRYVRRYMQNEFTKLENRRVGFPWSEQSVRRSTSSVGGTLAAARAVCAVSGARPPRAGDAPWHNMTRNVGRI